MKAKLKIATFSKDTTNTIRHTITEIGVVANVRFLTHDNGNDPPPLPTALITDGLKHRVLQNVLISRV